MKLLTRLIRARAGTVENLADELNIGYHSVFKVVHGSINRSKTGRIYHYDALYIREAVAEWLGLPYDHVWGPNAAAYLKPLLRAEIEREIEQAAEIEKEQKIQALGL